MPCANALLQAREPAQAPATAIAKTTDRFMFQISCVPAGASSCQGNGRLTQAVPPQLLLNGPRHKRRKNFLSGTIGQTPSESARLGWLRRCLRALRDD